MTFFIMAIFEMESTLPPGFCFSKANYEKVK